MKTFPNNFFWGAAASAPQTEGAALLHGKSASTWDKWFELEPQLFYQGIGPENTSNVYEQYKEDCQLMKDMSLNSYRTSISWTRLLPDGKTLNPEAISFYRNYFSELKKQGVEPIINLFHFDMPWWLMEIGGWENENASDYFAFYAKCAFEQFGDLISYWATFNEPMVHIECGYMGEAHYPKVKDFKRAIQVAYHTLMAHFKAVKAYRETKQKGQIGIILNLSPVYTKENPSKADLEAQEAADLFYIRSLLDPVAKGYFPEKLVEILRTSDLLPKIDPQARELMKYRVDFLGVNYYQPLRVQAQDHPREPIQGPGDFAKYYDEPTKVINPHRGWEIYPKGLYDIGKRLQKDYENLPWFVSENGMGVSEEERFIDEDGIVQDDYRIEFINDHLEYLHQVIEEGANCFGYHLWTFVDCWSWLNAYKNRYGFYRIDLENNFKRTPKKSSFWMKHVIEQNGID